MRLPTSAPGGDLANNGEMTTPPFSPILQLSDGREIPQFGLGLYKVADAAAAGLVEGAIDLGYRHVDTAALYDNERGVGEGMRASGVPREELFVTTKVWNDRHGFDETRRAFDESLEKLGLDYVDLYLIHWPAPQQDKYVEAWDALLKLREEGLTRSIGVSNFEPHHIDRLVQHSSVLPVINQVELHPWLQQEGVRGYNTSLGILTESWSPLARGRVLRDEAIVALAHKHGKTPAQVVLRWHVQEGLIVIPKSNSLERVRENADIFDFQLDAQDMAAIDRLDDEIRTGLHPDEHD